MNTPLYCAKFLHFHPGKKSSLHFHRVKQETFHVLDGECMVESGEGKHLLHKGGTLHIPVAEPHRVSSKFGCILLEVSTHHEDSDVVRIEPSGNL